MNQAQPASRAPQRWRYFLVAGLALVAIALGLGFRAQAPRAAAERARSALRPGVSIQEGLLAIPPEDRRFSLVLVARPEGLGRTSTLHFEGEGVRVAARDSLSKSGRVALNEALAQLSGEMASAEGELTGWSAELEFGGGRRAQVLLSPRGEILP